MRFSVDKISIGLDIIRNFLGSELSKPNSWNKPARFTPITIIMSFLFLY